MLAVLADGERRRSGPTPTASDEGNVGVVPDNLLGKIWVGFRGGDPVAPSSQNVLAKWPQVGSDVEHDVAVLDERATVSGPSKEPPRAASIST